jgi:hypothetical protein
LFVSDLQSFHCTLLSAVSAFRNSDLSTPIGGLSLVFLFSRFGFPQLRFVNTNRWAFSGFLIQPFRLSTTQICQHQSVGFLWSSYSAVSAFHNSDLSTPIGGLSLVLSFERRFVNTKTWWAFSTSFAQRMSADFGGP